MGLAHIIGQGVEELAHNGPRYPLLAEVNITLFGYNTEAGWIDPAEIEFLNNTKMIGYPASKIRGMGKEVSGQALRKLGNKVKKFILHFDVDVIEFEDFPAADVPHKFGLSFSEVMQIVEVFCTSPKIAALVITEFNPNRDKDGKQAKRLVEALVENLDQTGHN